MAQTSGKARKSADAADEQETPRCSNHPWRAAEVISTLNGAIREVRFCAKCVPAHWK